MKVIPFKGYNITFQAEGCFDLPAIRVQYPEGSLYSHAVICCWKANLWERIKFLFIGKVWSGLVCMQPQPQYLRIHKPEEIIQIQKGLKC